MFVSKYQHINYFALCLYLQQSYLQPTVYDQTFDGISNPKYRIIDYKDYKEYNLIYEHKYMQNIMLFLKSGFDKRSLKVLPQLS